MTNYFGFLPHSTFNGKGTLIGFLAGLDLFSQIRDKFGVGSGVVTFALSRLYF